jgi:hypothetical protein
MKLRLLFKLIAVTSFSAIAAFQPGHASSDDAWNALFKKVNGTCIGQSGMDTPEVTAPIIFDDAVGKVALLLRGTVGKGKSKISNATIMCLYDKKTGKASIQEYRWLGK